jgi:hypothetical protein
MSFYERDTRDGSFHRLDGTTVDLPFMYKFDLDFIAMHDRLKFLK